MSRRFIMAIVAAAVWPAGAVLADAPMVATLAKAAPSQEQILEGTIWRCSDTSCVSRSNPSSTGVSACRAVAAHFGQVVAFSSGSGNLDDSKLARCNLAVKSK